MAISTSLPSLAERIRAIPDFPRPGIIFRDITTLLEDADSLACAVDELARASAGMTVNKIVGIESRGFILGGALAYALNAGLVLVRKSGKLPHTTYSAAYSLEYGTDTVEIHQDAIRPGEQIWLHDDLLATGGTMAAAAELVTRCGGTILGASFLIELKGLGGKERLAESGITNITSLIEFDA